MRFRTVYRWSLMLLLTLFMQSAMSQIMVMDSSAFICTDVSDTARYIIINPSDSKDSVTLEIIDLPDTIQVNDFKDTLALGDTTELILSDFSGVDNGSYTFYIRVTQDTVVNDVLVVVEVDNIPPPPELSFPEDKRENIGLLSTFTWVPDGQPMYQFQLAIDSMFNTIIVEENVRISFIEDISLEEGTTYYWRVKGMNACGESGFSDTFSFSTVDLFCFNTSVEGPISLPGGDTSSFLSFQISPEIEGSIQDMNFGINAIHDSLQNVIVTIASPSGAFARLWSDICSTADTLNAYFDDEAESILECPDTVRASYRPAQPFSSFNNLSSQGVYEVIVETNMGGNGGSLIQMDLELCLVDLGQELLDVSIESVIICPSEAFQIGGTVGKRYKDSVEISVEAPEFISGIPTQEKFSTEDSIKIDFTVDEETFAPGKYNVVINVTDGPTTDTHILNIEILSLPGDTKPLTPEDGMGMLILQPELSWQSAEEVTGYEIVIGLDEQRDSIIYRTVVTDTVHTVMNSLEYDTQYFWTVNALGGCGGNPSDTLTFRTQETTSVEETFQGRLRIFPNPTSDQLIIDTELNFDVVEVIDLSGTILMIERHNPYLLRMGHFPKGIYIIRMVSPSHIVSRRIIKVE